ncbi:hypothetical protein AAE478_002388 [Parahypoxylon ruwenzoriense]
MEMLVDIRSDTPTPGNCNWEHHATAVADIFSEGSVNDEVVLKDCPILDAAVSRQPITRALPAGDNSYRETDKSASPSITPMNHNTAPQSPPSQSQSGCEAPAVQPGPLSLPRPLPDVLVRGLVKGYGHSNTCAIPRVQANFIVSHTPEMASGVLEAVYKELTRANKNYSRVLELRYNREGPYLRIVAPTNDAIQLIRAARDQTAEFLSNEASQTQGIFQEPPAAAENSQVILDINPLSGDVRPKLQPRQDVVSSPEPPAIFNEYASSIAGNVCRALKKAGRLPLSLTLRIHLGHYMLRTYPQGKTLYEYSEFNAMMKNPRASGWLKTWIGNETVAGRVLDFVRKDPRSPFLPIGNQTPTAADVLPEYIFEMRSQRAKFSAPFRLRTGTSARGDSVWEMYGMTVCSINPSSTELDVSNLSVGKELDWKLEAINKEKDAKTFPGALQFLNSAKVHVSNLDRPHDFDVYPRVALNRHNPIANRFKDVAVKTVYRFRWKATSYIVEIALNHRWDDISGMVSLTRPMIDLGISIYGEHWDSEDEAAGNIWGDELQLLLEGGNGGIVPTGIDRVGNFLQIVRDARDVFDPFFQGHQSASAHGLR